MIRRRTWTAEDLDELESRVKALEEALEELEEMEEPKASPEEDQLRQALLPLLLEAVKNIKGNPS